MKPILFAVDDEPDLTHLLSHAVCVIGACHLSTWNDADVLFRYLRSLVALSRPLPDLIVTDWHMPRTSGYEFILALKADPVLRKIPIVVFSSSQNPDDHEKARRAGCLAFLPKPSSLRGLFDVAKKLAALVQESSNRS